MTICTLSTGKGCLYVMKVHTYCRYNYVENCPRLEEFIDMQIAENEYDAYANLTLLKLYQLTPSL